MLDGKYLLLFFFKERERENIEHHTVSHQAPEICQGKHGRASYGTAADVYSATIVIWQILALEPLYPDMDSFDIMEYVGKQRGRPPVPQEWPEDLKKVLEDGWHQDPNSRCT